jgi:hypothetical protein
MVTKDSTVKFKHSVLEKIRISVAGRLDVMPGFVDVDAQMLEMGEELGMRLSYEIAAQKKTKEITLATPVYATWWDHLKGTYPVMQKVFGPANTKIVKATATVDFRVCFPDFIMPKNMGASYILASVDEQGIEISDPEKTKVYVEKGFYSNSCRY